MNPHEIKVASLGQLLETYEASASLQEKFSTKTPNIANKHAEIVAAIYRELRSRGRDTQLTLSRFFNHSDLGVRSWAAAHALEFSPIQGEKILEEISKEKTMTGFSAEITLKEWRKGSLRFP